MMRTGNYCRKVLVAMAAVALACVRLFAADVIVVTGAAGTEDYGKGFARAAAAWSKAGKQGEAKVTVIGQDEVTGRDLEKFQEALDGLDAGSAEPLWIVLIGHGTFDGRAAKFNMRGEDLSAAALAGMLKEVKRPVAIVNCATASAPFIKRLSGEDRVVVTATKSGYEDSYARFGTWLAESIASRDADLDQDGGTSLVEAFLAAAKAVEEFYEKEGRVATEEALLDDNGDGFGTPADWFRGVRAVKAAKDGAEVDGLRAHQWHLVPSEEERHLAPEIRRQRNALEAELFALRQRKGKMPEDVYFRKLEAILRQLAGLYAEAEAGDE